MGAVAARRRPSSALLSRFENMPVTGVGGMGLSCSTPSPNLHPTQLGGLSQDWMIFRACPVDPGLQKELVEHIELYPHTKMTLPSAILQSLGLHPTGESDIKKKRKDSSTKKRRHSSKSNSQDKESFN
ncbi:hypothetical protein GBAR_LOCUS3251 [Geodia barretti]|uniref:Uncharacterized protein n=1 Tax=Geodia barretti TaxID=519541 RepID=A0AA35W4D5_GEOBA|nr:hypothetical protein GBAR_LOCUS3251 [Geodia barretti]